MIIKSGTILTLEEGEYSDFTYTGPFFVRKDIDQSAVKAAFNAQWAPREIRNPDFPQCDHVRKEPYVEDFIAWLSKEGYIQDVECNHRWHLGSYGLDPSED